MKRTSLWPKSRESIIKVFNLQIPQRLYTLDELKLNGIETRSLLSPVDETLGSIERNLQLAAIAGGVSAWNVFSFNPQQILYLSLVLLFLWTVDSVISNLHTVAQSIFVVKIFSPINLLLCLIIVVFAGLLQWRSWQLGS